RPGPGPTRPTDPVHVGAPGGGTTRCDWPARSGMHQRSEGADHKVPARVAEHRPEGEAAGAFEDNGCPRAALGVAGDALADPRELREVEALGPTQGADSCEDLAVG